jgi:hypothetical protein
LDENAVPQHDLAAPAATLRFGCASATIEIPLPETVKE